MCKQLVLIIICFFSIESIGQYKNIDVPEIKEVATYEEVNLFVPIYVDKVNEELVIYVKNRMTTNIDSFLILLENEFDELAKEDFLQFNYTIIELIANRNLTMKELDLVIMKLRQNKLNKIILSSKTKILSRIENIWTTGTYHEFDIPKESIVDLKAKVIEKYLVRDIGEQHKGTNKNNVPPSLPPPPPPPPPPLENSEKIMEVVPKYYSEDMKVQFPNCKYTNVELLENKFILQGEEFSNIADLEKQLSKIEIDFKTIFVLSTSPNSKYQNYVEIFAVFNKVVFEQRQSLAKELYESDLLKLEPILIDEIVQKVPYNIIEIPIE